MHRFIPCRRLCSTLVKRGARRIIALAIVLGFVGLIFSNPIARAAPTDPQNTLSLLLTADTEGHVDPCVQCPMHAGDGGLARRATAVAQARSVSPRPLLLDAGNSLFGSDSFESDGKVIATAYNALQYDAVNLSYRDFHSGKARTLELIQSSKANFLSANLVDEATGNLLALPFIVKDSGGSKVALIGLTLPPAGVAQLPHMKRQLAGITFRAPADALAEWLPKARAESPRIILLYYGPVAALREIRARFGKQLMAICVGGIGDDQLPSDTLTPMLRAEEHGRSMTSVQISGDDKPKLIVARIPLDPSVALDPDMLKTLAPFDPPSESLFVTSASQPSMTATKRFTPPSTTQAAIVAATQSTVAVTQSTVTATQTPSAEKPMRPPVVVSTAEIPTPTEGTAADAPKRVTAKQPRIPLGLSGVGLKSERVNAAIEHGRDFLWAHLQAQHAKYKVNTLVDGGPDLLSALALVHAGAPQKYPEFDAQLRAYLTKFDPRTTQLGTYESGLFCMLIEAYGDPVFLPKLRDTARYLLELQGAEGTWGYGYSIPSTIYGPVSLGNGKALQVFGGTPLEGSNPGVDVLDRLTDYGKNHDGDNSVSQFALLGLQAASRWHVLAAPETWKRNLAAYRARQCEDGGWDYLNKGATGYGSMTCAGICALAIDRYETGEKEATVDEQLERGLAWLDRNFSVSTNPANGTNHLYYYLYSLERVGRILDTEFIGSHEWYPLGARFLVDNQKPNGKWVELTDDEDPRLATSFALLFLTRATATLTPDIARNGSGELRTSLSTAPPARLYIILDASGSMLDEMDGRLKFDVARDAVSAMLNVLPAHAQAALRVYGHRKRSIEAGADDDTELLIPMGEYDPVKFNLTLKSLRSRGKTPMALSLTQAANDIGGSVEPTTLVLLTDGGEDTMPRRDPVRAAAEFTKFPNVTIHIIGFDVNQEDWNTQLREMAAASAAQYWPAPRGDDLNRAMRAALLGDPDYFAVIDAAGKEVHRGKFGDAKRLPEGRYELVTPFAGKEFRQPFWINTNAITAVGFDAAHTAHDTTAKTAVASPESKGTSAEKIPAPASSLVKRFCIKCGKPLRPAAAFCTECGTKVR